MEDKQKAQITLATLVAAPIAAWLIVAKLVYGFTPQTVRTSLGHLIRETPHLWPLWSALIGGLALAIGGLIVGFRLNEQTFAGAQFLKFYRGTELVTAAALARKTRKTNIRQITIAGVPMPVKAERTHVSLGGSTGVGKSTILKEMMVGCLERQDRMVILDPDGEFLSTFYKTGDKILNPYDSRTEGWSFFNEIREDYDFERYARSIVQQSDSADSEEWNDYGRLLFSEVARKVYNTSRNPSMREVFSWTNGRTMEELEAFVEGTNAQALFTGNARASGSARFVLSNKIPPHLKMPEGSFSLRDWLADPNGGNLFITWDENMRAALRSLISCWVDSVFSSVLGMKADDKRRVWTYLDELESLAKLPTLGDALTKGRKKGLCVVSGYQTYSQLVKVYGEQMAETMLANHRTVVAMGIGRMGEVTAEKMSRALGQHEVMRKRSGSSRRFGQMGTSSENEEIRPERVVMPSELMRLPDLQGYLAFPGDLPIAKFEIEHVNYQRSRSIPGILTPDGEILGA
ncbi:type IV secretion system DNA-binding domain-containing protein [Caballeronia sp. SBC2]|uniref:type IV secretion system DNA-binding domain-containing protein n=1 Tax=Caballeronia sp. SBC2 TaxID=2705547 RepID=UPI0013E16D40|nr:type IV secretion system DNA-binding domain-containing protein [Caballeronia sp. SBC2]QIE30381.1 Coupling protein TraD [Caballeronia sp. SBC2]